LAVDLSRSLPRFGRRFAEADERASVIGTGQVGGKAHGLLAARQALGPIEQRFAGRLLPDVPAFAVVGTGVFDAFVEENRLRERVRDDPRAPAIAAAFQRAALPAQVVGDLWALASRATAPLAVRSSSLLEDALRHPFAGVYATKMTPNNAFDPETRFRRIVEALKFVYASTFFPGARAYLEATGCAATEEKMAVVVQEVVGRRHGARFYPDLSGVARSWNFYPSGAAAPVEGALSLALGLGKTIVDGGRCWTCSPAHPRAAPPVAGIDELLDTTQRDFWAVNMGRAPAYDPTREEEYLVRCDLADAESDGVLRALASTYDPRSDRLAPGTGAPGVRVLNFAPVLAHDEPPVAEAVRALLQAFEETTGGAVEIEFAVNIHDAGPPRLGFLQVRPMAVAREAVEVADDDMSPPGALVATERALGNGVIGDIRDVVYVRPSGFDARHTRTIAAEVADANRRLLEAGRPYLLIGFGRWGSSDPWLGIPVGWGDVAGARVIVESTLPSMNVELSQGAHFFHNLISFGVPYLCVAHVAETGIDWRWLDAQPVEQEGAFVRHVRLDKALTVKVDGRRGRGAVRKGEP